MDDIYSELAEDSFNEAIPEENNDINIYKRWIWIKEDTDNLVLTELKWMPELLLIGKKSELTELLFEFEIQWAPGRSRRIEITQSPHIEYFLKFNEKPHESRE